MSTCKVWIHASWDEYGKRFYYQAFNTDMTQYGYVLVAEKEVPFNSPSDMALRQAMYNILQDKAKQVEAEAFDKASVLRQRAEELLALPAPKEEDIPMGSGD